MRSRPTLDADSRPNPGSRAHAAIVSIVTIVSVVSVVSIVSIVSIAIPWFSVGATALEASSSGLVPDQAMAPWTRLTTEHFTIYSGAGRQAGLALATDMEMLHQVLESLAGKNTTSPRPTLVYLFPSDEALQPFKPPIADGRKGSGRAVAGGFFVQRELANFIAINVRTSKRATETIQHEYLHYFAKYNLPRLPFWFSEGLAEYYSTFFVREGIGYVGAPVTRSLQLLSRSGDYHSTAHDLERLENMHRVKELYDDQRRASLAYSQSWALVHFLLSEDERAEKTLDFMRELATGQPADQAFLESFGHPPASFARDLQRYLAERNFPTFRARVATVPAPLMASLDPVERDVALADLALAVGNRPQAQRLYQDTRQRAAQIQPESTARIVAGRSTVGLARLALADRDYDRALLRAREAGDFIPESPLPLLVEGQAQRARAEAAGGREPIDFATKTFDAARQALRSSLELAPRFPAALVALGKTWLRDPRTPLSGDRFSMEGVRSFELALDLLPQRTGPVVQLASLHALTGHFDLATKVLDREKPRFLTDEGWESAWQTVGWIEARLLRHELARDGQSPLLRDQLDRLLGRVSYLHRLVDTKDQLSPLDPAVQELERLSQIESLWTDLQRTTRLAAKGDIESARTQLEDILQELRWNLQLEGDRVVQLEQEAERRLHLIDPSAP